MITLTSPPSLQPPRLDLPPVPFFGRAFDEYLRLFALDPAAWRGRAVLDVAAGPSSFTAEAGRRGIDAVAVDPLYGRPPAELAAQVREDCARMFVRMKAAPRLGRPGRSAPRRFPPAGPRRRCRPYFPSLEAAEAGCRTAAARFLADYEGNLRHGRYVRGALPLLPFLDGSFDLVLCAHLLFLHPGRFDFAWHVGACLELARVSAGEVRLSPLGGDEAGTGRRRYAELDRLRTELDARGIASEVRRVNRGFVAGHGSMLVLNPRPT